MVAGNESFRILFVGDVVGRPGRRALRELLPHILEEERPHFVIINSENSAGGFGVNRRSAKALFDAGADVLTNGNHTWDKVEAFELVDEDPRVLRPENLPPGTPGCGCGVFEAKCGTRVGVLNVIGRVFMNPAEDPFRAGRRMLDDMRAETPLLFVDFHGEATSEKQAFGWHVDGLATAVVGTHTHVPTADSRILKNGTAYQSDAGMTGGYEGVIGMDRDASLRRFLTGYPIRFEPATGDLRLDAVLIDADKQTGRATAIRRVQKRLLEG
ncbi:MAG: metallophosphoesterase [Gemmatimonadota bacterium]|nr:MAG: metallophosphoesterase [Gemmatimonadota bacterium]